MSASTKRHRGATRRLFANGRNPFRAGSASAEVWEIVVNEPGITYSELKARGARMRAVSYCLRMAWMTEVRHDPAG